jgi:hypothetical protein
VLLFRSMSPVVARKKCMTRNGYKATRWIGPSHVRLCLRKRTNESIAAAQKEFCGGYDSFAIRKRKKLAGFDLVAF